ncbi:hypothetical protein CB0940_00656 [Cercospora beticola]|uniref:Uncharacterized protein n=1 Tax=Cercospora beticola TaxID=122368 RepID=A0A2G5I6P6_CERBT|nr:hypothetical protein CB0940_00656 [Cercospora beticola]PIB00471.1 hypothetical protein CB0940_00656 [Cercospora beticola]
MLIMLPEIVIVDLDDTADEEDEEPVKRLRPSRKPVASLTVNQDDGSQGERPPSKKRAIQRVEPDNEAFITAQKGGLDPDLGDDPLEMVIIAPEPEQYRAVDYEHDWLPADFAELVLYSRTTWQWTFRVTGAVDKMLKKYMTPERYATGFCRRLRANSPQLYQMLDFCVATGQPWKLSDVVARLPDALDKQTCGQVIGNYLISLENTSKNHSTAGYFGGTWGLQSSIYARASKHSQPAYRQSDPDKELYKAWDSVVSTDIKARLRMICVHTRADIARYGTIGVLLNETLGIGLFCSG